MMGYKYKVGDCFRGVTTGATVKVIEQNSGMYICEIVELKEKYWYFERELDSLEVV